jgi:bifunctional non-homologous end joining protein LigD
MLTRFIPPQLLHRTRAAPDGEEWIHEIKYDGLRLHARIEKGRVRLLTRRGNDWTSHYPRVAAALAELGTGDAYLDGELVVPDAEGRPDFHALLTKRGARRAVYQAFDLLHAGGRDLLRLDLLTRKWMLAELLSGAAGTGVVRYTEHVVGSGPEVFAAARELRLEGTVAKRVGSRYLPGERSRDWLKVKAFERLTVRVAWVGATSARVHAEWGECLGEVALGGLRPLPGDLVEVQALPLGASGGLRHATLRRIVGAGAAARG